jgi:glycosidase
MKFAISTVLIIIIFFLHNCSIDQSSFKIPELIAFRTMEAGQADSIRLEDLFYKDQYDVEFFDNEFIDARLDTAIKYLVLKPSLDFRGLTFVKFKSDGDDKVLPVIVKRKAQVEFAYRPDKKPEKMFVMGNFNNWSRNSDQMLDEDGDGIFTKILSLDDGVYEYQFVIDKKEIFDPKNPEKVDNGFGYYNSVKRVKSADNANNPNVFFHKKKSGKWLELAIDVENNDYLKFYVLLDNNIYSEKFYELVNNKIRVNLKPLEVLPGMHALRIVATQNEQPGNVLTVWIKDGSLESASKSFTWNDAIIYSVMPDRFFNGNVQNDQPVKRPELSDQANFKGGDLEGIQQKLKEGYFDSLGVNTLWIFPLNKTTNKAFKEWPEPHRYYTGYHGYWPVEPREVEPRFGTLQDFQNIVNEAHKRKFKVLLDFISNHTHIEHPYYKNNPQWYGKVDLPNGEKNIRRWDEYRLTTWFDTFLPSFDYLNSDAVTETVTDDALWWIENTNIDGFRHDATKHVPHQFWQTLTKKIKSKINPQRELPLYQIGETFGSDNLIKSYVNNGMLDAQFNFNQFFIARRVFSEKDGNFLDLGSSIEKSLQVYGYNNIMGNLMDSHDQVRMMALFDGDITLSDNAVERAFQMPKIEVDNNSSYDKEFIYFTYMLTVPGVPVIYYGDEFGMTGAGDPDNRRMMRFEDELKPIEKAQLKKIKKLIHFRKDHSAFRRGDYQTLLVTKDILAYTRGDIHNRFIVVINKNNQSQNVNLSLPLWMPFENAYSLLSMKEHQISAGNLNLQLGPYSSDILELK